MSHLAPAKSAMHLRRRAVEFDYLAQHVHDPDVRAQFNALKERFEQYACSVGGQPADQQPGG